MDSKGISVYNFSDWHERITTDKKYKGLKRYRKFHVMMDLETREVLNSRVFATLYTAQRTRKNASGIYNQYITSCLFKMRQF
ncbi:hypothetical protein [Candidatus Lariskella endosymbiont of Epinotia ramella]|uniref:hypothetical protein n=1 Tax=Candidatus Lariskella endosymbiont of Epinotia ramella TaxID=3066224 RepID=UPI0030CE6334